MAMATSWVSSYSLTKIRYGAVGKGGAGAAWDGGAADGVGADDVVASADGTGVVADRARAAADETWPRRMGLGWRRDEGMALDMLVRDRKVLSMTCGAL